MFIELIDLLRCPREHEETWLVAAFNRMDGRFVVEGKLGCPVCNANYSVVNGVPDLRTAPVPRTQDHEPRDPADPEAAMKLAAFLNLTREGSIVLLSGNHANTAQGVADLTMSRTFALRAQPEGGDESELVATVLADTRLPFATASVDGLAVDSDHDFPIDEIARVLKPGARVVAPSTTKLAGNIRELARDDAWVVGEAVGALFSLRRTSDR